jgi:hypothetical protein
MTPYPALHRKTVLLACVLSVAALGGCTTAPAPDVTVRQSATALRDPLVVELKREPFQRVVDGKPVDLYTLRNTAGAEVMSHG